MSIPAPAAPTPPPTGPGALDTALGDLQAHKTEWARLPIPRKIELLEGLRERTAAAAARWVEAAAAAKGLPPGSPLRGEEWASGPWALLHYLGPLRRTLEHAASGTLMELVRGRTRRRPDGQTVVRVMPSGLRDHLLFGGLEVEVWMEPGVTPESLPDTMATWYRRRAPEGAVALVLGAGNIAAIPPLDVLYKLYAEGRVCLLKMNPVNSHLGPILEQVFQEFVRAGYLRFAYGGADTGAYLTRHHAVDEIHVTGSAATHDAIVFGAGEEGRRRKERDEPEIDKRVTSELGGVGPVVVVPGPWSEADIRFQAEHVATIKMHNAGFNCIAGQVLVLPSDWALRDALVHAVRRVLRELPDRPAYYPGAEDRARAACEAYPGAVERLGPSGARLLLPHVPADAGEQHAFASEFFGAALAVTPLPGGAPGENPGDFLDRAVNFCNQRLLGSLGMSILIHPRTAEELGGRLEEAVARLRYGTVGVNTWSGVGFLIAQAPWGAFPGHTRTDIQSGRGFVHNALLFDQPQKTVLRGPFAPFPRSLRLGELHASPKPPWFVTSRTAETTFRRLTSYTAAPGPLKLAGIVASALRG